MSEPSTELPPRAWVEVDLGALCANAATLLRAAGPGGALLPMVKADAYGLGLTRVAAALAYTLRHGGMGGFGVAAVAEGEVLRTAGWQGRTLVLSPLATADYPRAAAAGLTLSLSSIEAVTQWARAARDAGRRLPFHLEIDTGMGRSGFPVRDLDTWAPAVVEQASQSLDWEGCLTHFHSADEPDLRPTEGQWSAFLAAGRRLEPLVAPRRLELHAANSAATLRCAYPADLVRPGIFLYGGRVGAEPPKPVVAVRARVVLVRSVPEGTTVGYGATHRAGAGGERWATLAVGYGDGLPRILGAAGGEALVRGRRAKIVGRISMDTAVVDVSGVSGVEVDDVATLIGQDGNESITVDDVAQRAGTISYEILTGLTARLPRLYRGAPELLAATLSDDGT